MPVASWPYELPTGFLEGTDHEVAENNVLVTQMDVGPAKRRRRTTAGTGTLEGTLRVSAQQRQIFDQFWRTTLRSGALPFLFGGVALLGFKQPPEYRTLKAGNGLYYDISIVLEILP